MSGSTSSVRHSGPPWAALIVAWTITSTGLSCAIKADPPYLEQFCQVTSDCKAGHRCLILADGEYSLRVPIDVLASTSGGTSGTETPTSGLDSTGGEQLDTTSSPSDDTTSGSTSGSTSGLGGTSWSGPSEIGICSKECFDEECIAIFPNTECTLAGRCASVDCGRLVDCAEASDYCDVSANVCFARSGSCTTRSDCPVYPDYFGSNAITCIDGWCRWSDALVRPDGLSPATTEPIRVLAPQPGEVIERTEDFFLRWDASEPAIIVITAQPPKDAATLTDDAIWYAAVPAGTDRVRWDQGQGADGQRPPLPLPTDITLYAVVFTVELGELQAVSAAIPFGVGSPFPVDGDRCIADDTSPMLPCPSPTRPLGCVEGRCRTLCVSSVECTAGTTCGPEHRSTGLRFCE